MVRDADVTAAIRKEIRLSAREDCSGIWHLLTQIHLTVFPDVTIPQGEDGLNLPDQSSVFMWKSYLRFLEEREFIESIDKIKFAFADTDLDIYQEGVLTYISVEEFFSRLRYQDFFYGSGAPFYYITMKDD